MTAIKIIVAVLLSLAIGHWLLWRVMRRWISAPKQAQEIEP